ncbi:hypothetical protein JCM31271_27130 [Halorubrum trueperi]
MDEFVVVVETLLDGQPAQIGELDGVVLATAVDRDQVPSFEIEDISANCAVGDIDRVIVGEITVAPGMRCVEIPEEPAFSRVGVEMADSLPRGRGSLGGVVIVWGPIPAGSKIEVTLGPCGIPFREMSVDCRGGDESDVEPVGEDSDSRGCADARAAVCKGGLRAAVQQEREGGGIVEFAMECDRPFRERAEVGVDWTAPRADDGDCVGEVVPESEAESWLITMPSKKRIERVEAGTDDKGNWEVYYTNLDPEQFGGERGELVGRAGAYEPQSRAVRWVGNRTTVPEEMDDRDRVSTDEA